MPALAELPVALPATLDEASDEQLVGGVRAGDDRAFEQLYGRYRRRVHGYVYVRVRDHGRAEDVTQEVFISALRRMRATERPIAFSPWIHEIARNACIDAYRRSRWVGRDVSYDVVDAGDQPALAESIEASDPSPQRVLETKQDVRDLCGAFSGLSESHHRILVLRELEGRSYREIGDEMGLSRPAVESTLLRARRRLSAEYEELATGRRCAHVQTIIAESRADELGVRERKRLERHLSHCQRCRALAQVAGLPAVAGASAWGRRLAALLLPLPSLRGLGLPWRSARALSSQPAMTLGTVAESTAAVGWGRAVTGLALLAAAGLGAGTAIHSATVAPPRHGAAATRSAGGGAFAVALGGVAAVANRIAAASVVAAVTTGQGGRLGGGHGSAGAIALGKRTGGGAPGGVGRGPPTTGAGTSSVPSVNLPRGVGSAGQGGGPRAPGLPSGAGDPPKVDTNPPKPPGAPKVELPRAPDAPPPPSSPAAPAPPKAPDTTGVGTSAPGVPDPPAHAPRTPDAGGRALP